MTKTLPLYHVYHMGVPFTYFVFGPYTVASSTGDYPEWDVEVWEDHIQDWQRHGKGYFLTISSLPRSTHIVQDVWTAMDEAMEKEWSNA